MKKLHNLTAEDKNRIVLFDQLGYDPDILFIRMKEAIIDQDSINRLSLSSADIEFYRRIRYGNKFDGAACYFVDVISAGRRRNTFFQRFEDAYKAITDAEWDASVTKLFAVNVSQNGEKLISELYSRVIFRDERMQA